MKADDEVDDGDSMAAYNEGDTGKLNNIRFSCAFAMFLFLNFSPPLNF